MSSYPVALAPDPVVPQRDHLMDLDAVARLFSMRLGRRGPVPIRSCRIDRVSYRPGNRLRTVYRVGTGGPDTYVAASTFHARSRGERAYEKAAGTAGGSGALRPVLYDAELDTVFWTFPNDRKIENLSAVAEAREDLRRLLDRYWARSCLVDYKPETSAVVGCLDDASRVIGYAKVHAGDEGERTHRVQETVTRLARGSGLRIARPLAYSRQYRTLLVEPIAGTSIRWLAGAGLLAGLHAYGAALARLHSLPLPARPDDLAMGGRDALERLRHRAEGVRAVRPDVGEQVSELLGELTARWGEVPERRVPIHGDANESNAILQGDRLVLIDFDRACVGVAGSDIGNFLSLLRYFRSLGVISPRAERARAAAFARGYSSVRALPHPDSLRVHESAALAERAFRSVARLRGSALLRLPAFLAEAWGLLR
ncbi:MAG: phosphotransferase family protein [Carbonactinosporaceae bacterium]